MRNLAVSPPGSRRRAVFAARRTKSGALVGFHGRRSQSMTEVPGCLVLAPAILAALPALEELTALAGSRKGELSITVTTSENGLDIALNGGKPLDANLRQIVSDIAQMHGIARLTADGELIAARAPPIQRFGTARVTPPPGAFLQATPQGQAALTSAMVEAVGEARGIVDLFSGCGTFTFPAAERAAVHAVESDADMITALDQAQRHSTGLKPVTGEVRDLFRRPLRSEELARFDAAIIDPPRAGAEAQTAALAEAALARIAFVSCNPVTFARDAEILTGAGYRLDWIDVIDQFRWSPHIELAAGFRRAT